VTKKEFLVVIFSFEKFGYYLIGSHIIVYTNHSTFKHHHSMKDAKLRFVRWIWLLKEFSSEIRDKKGYENPVVCH